MPGYQTYGANKQLPISLSNDAQWQAIDLAAFIAASSSNLVGTSVSTMTAFAFLFESNSTACSYGLENGDVDTSGGAGWISPTNSRLCKPYWVKPNATSQIKAYLSNRTASRIRLIGESNAFTWLGAPVSVGDQVTSTATKKIDLTSLLPTVAPFAGHVLVEQSKAIRIGTPGTTATMKKYMAANIGRMQRVVTLGVGADSNMIEVSGQGGALAADDIRILAYLPSEAFERNADYATNIFMNNAGANQWNTLGFASPYALTQWLLSNSANYTSIPSAIIAEMRPSGDSTYPASGIYIDADSNAGIRLLASGNGGQFDAYNSTTAEYYMWDGGFVSDTGRAISSISSLITAVQATALFLQNFAPVSFSITGGGVTKTSTATIIDADEANLTPPQWVDGSTCIKLGAVDVTATDGTNTTLPFADTLEMSYQHPDASSLIDFSWVVLTSVSGNAMQVIPALAVGTQIAYDASRFTVSPDGTIEASYEGQSAIWYRLDSDKIARLVLMTTDGSGAVIRIIQGKTISGSTLKGKTL